jgi:hypothetical protein
MFQSALLYLQQDFAKQRYIRSNAMILPHVLRVWQQSNRACQFLQYSFSSPFALVGKALMPKYSTQKDRQGFVSYAQTSHCERKANSEPEAVVTGSNSPQIQQTAVGRLIQNREQ